MLCRNTDLESVLFLLATACDDVMVFLQDGWDPLQPAKGVHVQLHLRVRHRGVLQ